MKKAFAFIMPFIFLILSSCIMPTSDVVVSPAMKSSQIKKIAVWRFRDGGKIANSGDIATSSIESALMEKGFGLVSYSQIREVLSVEIGYREGMALEAGMLTPKVLSRIYQDTGVDAIVIGSVSESWCDIMWVPPCRLAVAFKMISTHSGELIVSANASDEGSSIERAALKMARKAISRIR
jgi:hypothetical protein